MFRQLATADLSLFWVLLACGSMAGRKRGNGVGWAERSEAHADRVKVKTGRTWARRCAALPTVRLIAVL
jgi:hypothetical protein